MVKDDDILQGYLTELLESDTPAPAAQPVAEPDLSEVRREQLQKLLQSARLQVEQVAETPPSRLRRQRWWRRKRPPRS